MKAESTAHQFTDEERYLASAWLSSAASKRTPFDAVTLAGCVVFVVLSIKKNDGSWAALSFLILFYRVVWGMWQHRKWAPVARSIIVKYEGQIAELKAALAQREPSVLASPEPPPAPPVEGQ